MQATTVDGAFKRINALTNPEHTPTEEVTAEAAPEQHTTDTPEPIDQEQDSQPEIEVVMHTVKVNGEEIEVPEDEMRGGYMKNADYQRKTKDLHKRSEALKEKEGTIDTQLSEASTLLDMELQNLESPEMLDLKENNPDSYVKELDRVQRKFNNFNKAKQQRNVELQSERSELATKEMAALEAAIPEWLDADIKAVEANEVMKRWADQGYSNEEINNVLDHKRFVSERKAMLYDKLMNQDLSEKKVKTPPKAQKPGVSTSGEDRTDSKVKDMRGKLRKSGKTQDAAKLFRSMMEK